MEFRHINPDFVNELMQELPYCDYTSAAYIELLQVGGRRLSKGEMHRIQGPAIQKLL